METSETGILSALMTLQVTHPSILFLYRFGTSRSFRPDEEALWNDDLSDSEQQLLEEENSGENITTNHSKLSSLHSTKSHCADCWQTCVMDDSF